jgi:hypothetical protein
MQSKNNIIMLYASELAACVGKNPYNEPYQVARKMWERLEVDSYRAALQRNTGNLPDDLSLVPAKAGQLKIDAVVEHLNTQSDGKLDFYKILHDVVQSNADVMVDKLQQVMCMDNVAQLDKDSRKELQHYVFTKRGQQQEEMAIKKYEEVEEKPVEHNNDTFFKLLLPLETVVIVPKKRYRGQAERKPFKVVTNFAVGGRVDGIRTDGKLVEVKNRQRKLYEKLPEYEIVQVHTYLALTGLNECDVIQRYGDQMKTDTVVFNKDYWNDVVEGASTFVKAFQGLIRSSQLQDDLLVKQQFGS